MTRILLVDDSDDVRRSVRAVLAGAVPDPAIGEAADAAGALALLAQQRWDVVVLDLSLPDRSGLETLRDIRRLQPALPVVVMSFHGEVEYAAAARAAGAASYIAKGSPAGVIADAITSALSGTAPARS
ncbi:MAG TPA: response regulator [Polyangia bacterium]|nr:response regulator [Polyangia bacterium]